MYLICTCTCIPLGLIDLLYTCTSVYMTCIIIIYNLNFNVYIKTSLYNNYNYSFLQHMYVCLGLNLNANFRALLNCHILNSLHYSYYTCTMYLHKPVVLNINMSEIGHLASYYNKTISINIITVWFRNFLLTNDTIITQHCLNYIIHVYIVCY